MTRAARLLALAAVLGLHDPAAAQPRRAQVADPVNASIYREVFQVREKVRAAIAAKDRAGLEALYADNFRHLRDSGRADMKPERIQILLSGEQTIETAPEDGVEVQSYGDATAVASGTSRVADPSTGKPAAFRWLTVYVKGEAGWRIATSQASRVRAR